MATSTIENTSGGLITDGFISNNPNVLITSQSSFTMRGRLINSVVHITVSADQPKYTSLFKPKEHIAWGGIDYIFLDTKGNLFQRHPNYSTGVQTTINGLVAGDYTLIIPC
jgi:hypothetical protein